MEHYRRTIVRIFNLCARFLFPESENEHLVANLKRENLSSLLLVISHGHATTLLPYRHRTVRALIWQLKYRRDAQAAALLGEVLALHIRVYERPIIIPIPLSKSRTRERGYNQVALVVREAIAHLPGATMLPEALYWTREVPHQTTLGRRERTKNVVGALRARNLETDGRAVIVVDDVMTTGSTLLSAKRALQDAGIRDPILVALAH